MEEIGKVSRRLLEALSKRRPKSKRSRSREDEACSKSAASLLRCLLDYAFPDGDHARMSPTAEARDATSLSLGQSAGAVRSEPSFTADARGQRGGRKVACNSIAPPKCQCSWRQWQAPSAWAEKPPSATCHAPSTQMSTTHAWSSVQASSQQLQDRQIPGFSILDRALAASILPWSSWVATAKPSSCTPS